MKKINKLILLSFFALFLIYTLMLSSCQNPDASDDQDTGYIQLITPDYAPLDKAVFGMNSDEVQDIQGGIRYDIVIETNGSVYKKYTLKKNEKANIEVPAGRKFDVGVGIYLVKSRSDSNVLINSYFVSDVEKGIIAPAGDTVYIKLTLNYNRPSEFTYYYTDSNGLNLGMADITGSVIYETSGVSRFVPLFISTKMYSGTPNVSWYYGENFLLNSPRAALAHTGKIFTVNNTATTVYNWYIDNTDKVIRYVNMGEIAIDNIASFINSNNNELLFTYENDARSYLPAVDRAVSILYNADLQTISRHYFLLHKNGMLKTSLPSRSPVMINTDFSSYSSIHPNLPFVLDIKRVAENSSNNYFFLTKLGAYLVDLAGFSDPARLKRKIEIKDNYDPRLNQIITGVQILGSSIYLSTSQGIYKISRNSTAWTDFLNSSPAEYNIFPENKIEKVKLFSGKKVMSIYGGGNDILMIATNESVCFLNTANGAFREYTIWNGLPFIPANKPSYEADFDQNDYPRCGMSPVRNILWDAQFQKYWIATMHGLVSIDKSDVF